MSCRPFCPTIRVYDPPVTVVNDVFHPQIVEVVHQVNVVTRHHCVPVERHLYQYCHHDENASPQGNHSHRSHKSNRSRSGRSYISKAKKKKMKS